MQALILPILIGFALFGMQKCKSVDVGDSDPVGETTEFTCVGKTRCPDMKSCAEATFYLRNCPGVEIDGDGDGIPCEEQFCGNIR